MAKLQELQGWRRASGEELDYIRGALGTRIKRDRNTGRLAAGAITLLGLGLTGAIWPMAVSMVREISGDWDGETDIVSHFGESGIAGKFKDSQGTLYDDVI